ncbi:Por secretion system protein [Prevotella sp. E13-27]|uniref:type IX secretion system anionic LPS delivery protein PorZ n=1 Tax=Prevotella sp. E13-27 TaxID=2938122 RepID=UPI00200A2581|nr:Por secretion system protein [Prevotella sp. E13-27]MCK8621626.1 Por secretion system protein [Prevotella sp. E13-27]
MMKQSITKNWIKILMVVAFCLQFSLLSFQSSECKAQTGLWRAYMAYSEPQQIVKGGNKLYVRASTNLYSYNLNDHSITTYDKIGILSDTRITHIAWSDEAKKLIIVYENKNIDLLAADDEVFNLSSYYSRSMTQDKTINTIYINGHIAYLCTRFGLVKIDMRENEIAESYILRHNITGMGIVGSAIYAKVEDATTYVITANTGANLIDPSSWTTTTDYPANIFDVSTADWDNYIEIVKTLKPGGPMHNVFEFMRFKNNTLYSCGGGFKSAQLLDLETPANIQILSSDREWTISEGENDIRGRFEDTKHESWQFIDMMAFDVDPADPTHIFGGARSGLYEFKDGKVVNYYNLSNSILETAVAGNPSYVLVEGVMYDSEGNLWILQSITPNNSLLVITKDGEWKKLNPSELIYNEKRVLGALQFLLMDSRGLIWFVNNHYDRPSFFCYDPKTKEVINTFTKFTNQDGTSYGSDTYYPRCFAEDLDGNIWIGTSIGAFMIEAANIYTPGTYLTQVKVPRNDGSDLADYLLSSANVTSIVIDGAGRKWFGTIGSGAYLISRDNMEEIHHFTAENTQLLSNDVMSIAVDDRTGEVFFGTEKGLCSYISDATAAVDEMKKDDVYAFPNPVPSGYKGLITVRGLSFDADVKILTVSGKLVAQGRSNGGTFTWNGRDLKGRRVASGVYMIATATSDGKSGVVAKVAIVN